MQVLKIVSFINNSLQKKQHVQRKTHFLNKRLEYRFPTVIFVKKNKEAF